MLKIQEVSAGGSRGGGRVAIVKYSYTPRVFSITMAYFPGGNHYQSLVLEEWRKAILLTPAHSSLPVLPQRGDSYIRRKQVNVIGQ